GERVMRNRQVHQGEAVIRVDDGFERLRQQRAIYPGMLVRGEGTSEQAEKVGFEETPRLVLQDWKKTLTHAVVLQRHGPPFAKRNAVKHAAGRVEPFDESGI